MKDHFVWETKLAGGRYYPVFGDSTIQHLHDGVGSERAEMVNVKMDGKGEDWYNRGLLIFSKSKDTLNVPLVHYNNFVKSIHSLFELFPYYVWEHLDVGLYRFTGYSKIKNSGVVRINNDYTFTLLGEIVSSSGILPN